MKIRISVAAGLLALAPVATAATSSGRMQTLPFMGPSLDCKQIEGYSHDAEAKALCAVAKVYSYKRAPLCDSLNPGTREFCLAYLNPARFGCSGVAKEWEDDCFSFQDWWDGAAEEELAYVINWAMGGPPGHEVCEKYNNEYITGLCLLARRGKFDTCKGLRTPSGRLQSFIPQLCEMSGMVGVDTCAQVVGQFPMLDLTGTDAAVFCWGWVTPGP